MKRFKKYLKHLFIRYVPSSQLIADKESQRLVKFLTDNYTEQQQLFILTQMQSYLVEYRIQQINDSKKAIQDEHERLEKLEINLEHLTV